jgi:hypothetical protein
MSPEFRGDEKRNPRKLMEDGIIRMRGKKFRRRLSEIDAELRLRERKTGTGTGGDFVGGDDDLITEKMYIDQEMRKLEGKTG